MWSEPATQLTAFGTAAASHQDYVYQCHWAMGRPVNPRLDAQITIASADQPRLDAQPVHPRLDAQIAVVKQPRLNA